MNLVSYLSESQQAAEIKEHPLSSFSSHDGTQL